MARHNKRFCLLAVGLSLLLWSRDARAYDEQASLDMAVGGTLLSGMQHGPLGAPALELGAGLGLGDAVVLRANLAWLLLLGSERDQLRHEQAGRLRVEAIYQLDVLQFVPFFGLGGTLITAVDSAATVPLRAGGHVVLGLDYLLSRRWICGLDLRSALLAEGHQLLNATDISVRLSRMFETF